ncbi:trifunctional serine/threonine-protein kinase/ATP-binding protein/sensor histidine kinase [Allocoleopsis sp.]|uniref:trifunctional serine/threonine-protein kinase/ATP-binding protein/sensor histidine kinase n=1 Tax=Allocoleopsis sp. TaxID=3088169 RepID=UPI002FD3D722
MASSPQHKYTNLSKIHEGIATLIYRGTREPDSTSVIIKTLKAEYPTLEEITRLKHEYKILQLLNVEGVVKALSLETYNNRLALVLEDFQGIYLHRFLNNQKISVLTFLSLARQLAEILHKLHQNHVIHKNIKPHNILINPQSEHIKLIDFSIASRLSKENLTISNPNFLEGTLAYMSPEQTGRMNRSLDYRTDFYSLGVTFYEMLTGQLPFVSNDPLELVHCHIAKTPVPVHQLNSEVPLAVSSIIMKLLAKTAEDRYQSAVGLKADLEEVWQKLQASGQIEGFIPGRLDRSSSFLIPQKLYGREGEVTALMNAFERTSKGASEMMLVSGYSGIGKTSVVNEVHKLIVAKRGYFITGKFDQFKRDIPYAALIQSFQELIQQLLTESSEQIAVWRAKLEEAIGSNGRVITDVIPEIKLIVGEQPEVPLLGPTESQNRFNQIFKQFLSVFTKAEHPLVIFLDDLQWADLASLKWIELLITDPESQYLLLIAAYRDNEVTPTHPTMLTVEEIQKAGAKVNNIVLQPLEISTVAQLVADTLNRAENSRELVELLFKKTQGNPFFITQLFQTLYSGQLLSFDFAANCWTWDIKQWDIKQTEVLGINNSNVVELVARNISQLPQVTQQVLKLAACIGNQFTLDILAIVSEEMPSSTANKLWSALQAGLILPLSNDYKIPLVFEEGDWRFEAEQSSVPNGSPSAATLTLTQPPISYKFLHDRVQQAAYSLIPSDRKKATHWKIGQLLLEKTAKFSLEDNIFDIVNQLNIGLEFITSESEKEELANLNLIAGRKAKAAMAYEPAARYFNVGLELLAETGWENHYDLAIALHIEAVESEYLRINFERAAWLAEIVLERANTLLEKVRIYELQIQFYNAQNQMLKALDIGLQVLTLLGVSLSSIPSDSHLRVELPELTNLENLPVMKDPYKLAAMRILKAISSSVFIAKPELLPQVILTMVNLCIENGYSALASYAYVWYATLLCGRMGNLDAGYHAGQLALRLLQEFNAKELKCLVFTLFNCCVRHWKEHSREILTPFLEGIQSGIETGDLEYAGYSIIEYCTHIFLTEEQLEIVSNKQSQYIDLLVKLKQEYAIYQTRIWGQLTLNLQGLATDKYCLIGEIFDESKILPILIDANTYGSLFYIYIAKSILFYLFKEYDRAIAYAKLASEHESSVTGLVIVSLHNFYYSLALLAQYPHAESHEQHQYLSQVSENQEKMKQWAYHAPMNYQHKYDLVKAEKARVLEQNWEAVELYNRAIVGAKDNGYIQDEALANELAAEFYLTNGKEKMAQTYLKDAYYGYARWGAKAKVQDLEARYPQLFARVVSRQTPTSLTPGETIVPGSSKTTTSTMIEDSRVLDLATVMKASLALAEEIVLDKLLSKFMKVILENAGAQKGFLIMEKSGKLVIEAAGAIDIEQVMVLQSIAVKNNPNIPAAIINYVERTQQNLVVNEAARESIFATDPYIAANQPKSILCSPIIKQGKLLGILYLENNQCAGAFTSDRIELLNILTSQAAISLENARLYNNVETANSQLEVARLQLEEYSHTLEAKVEERTQELQEKNRQLEQTLLELRTAQRQIVAQEKLASLGALTAGIAHEIRNPLNFVTSLASLSEGLTTELCNTLDSQIERREEASTDTIHEILTYLKRNVSEIYQQGQRANTIIQSMLLHVRSNKSQRQTTDFNTLVTQAVQLAYHSQRNRDSDINLTLNINCDDAISKLELFPSDFSRAIINIVDNACYAAMVKHKQGDASFTPIVSVTTKNQGAVVEIRIRDNGTGIAPEIREKIFHPFFTTKPTGQGTGLGLSLTHDIIVGQHRGTLEVQSEPGVYTEFFITLPKNLGISNRQ